MFQSREASDTLRKRIELAEQILRQAEICRKLETEEEKILPFYAESVSAEELAAAGGDSKKLTVFLYLSQSLF